MELQIQNRSGVIFGLKGQGQFGTRTTVMEGTGDLSWR
jgi:hypothetical protein